MCRHARKQLNILLVVMHKSSYIRGMNKLPLAKRVQILSMLCEGSSMRSIARVCDVSFNTVAKFLIDAGKVCAAFHDEQVRDVKATRVQVDEIWSFTLREAEERGEGESRSGRGRRYVDVDSD